MVTQKRLNEIFAYNSRTGVVTAKIRRGNLLPGSEIGTADHLGYKRCYVDGRNYLLHRLIWIYVYGIEPSGFIDHIDGNPSNNSLENIRLATCRQNQANRRTSFNKVWPKGVHFRASRPRRPWRAIIERNGKSTHLGSFATMEQAAEARRRAAEAFDGEFVRHD